MRILKLLMPALLLPAAVFCTPVQWSGNGHHYEVASTGADWLVANDTATQSIFMGVRGHLATFESLLEEIFVIGLAQVPTSSRLHIGLSVQPGGSVGNPNDYVWVDGSPVTYSNWGPGQPFTFFTNSYYGSLYYSSNLDWQWGNIPAGLGPYLYVIEYDVPPAAVPEPSTLAVMAGAVVVLMRRRRRPRTVN